MPQRAFVNGWYGFERLLFLQIDFAKWFFAQFGFGFVFVCSGYTFFSVVCAFVRWKRPPVQRNFASFAIFFFLRLAHIFRGYCGFGFMPLQC